MRHEDLVFQTHPVVNFKIMKPLFISFLLLFVPLIAMPSENTRSATAKRNVKCDLGYWRPDSKVNVYFFRDMFTAEQRQALLAALESWEGSATTEVSFKDAGETAGLIDCESCLTVARQTGYRNDKKGYASLNVMRRNETGRLTSAWIGFDGSTRDSVALRGLLLEALRNGRGIKEVSLCGR